MLINSSSLLTFIVCLRCSVSWVIQLRPRFFSLFNTALLSHSFFKILIHFWAWSTAQRLRNYVITSQFSNTSVLSELNAQLSSFCNVRLLNILSYEQSLRNSSTNTAKNSKIDLLEKLYDKFWARVTTSFVDSWVRELLVILLSVIAFVFIIVLLRKYDDHILSRLPHDVTLNFIVFIIATVAKSTLLLVVASSLGQFKWLWMFFKQRRLQNLQIFDEVSRDFLMLLNYL